MGSTRYPTRHDVTQAVSEVAASDQETLATVADLINSGQVRLFGHGGYSGLKPETVARGLAGEAWTAHSPAIKGPATPMSGALRPGRDESHAV